MSGYVYDLPTRTGTVTELRKGTVIMESPLHPAVVIRTTRTDPMNVYCLYIWQERTDRPWLLGRFRKGARVKIVLTPADALATGS